MKLFFSVALLWLSGTTTPVALEISLARALPCAAPGTTLAHLPLATADVRVTVSVPLCDGRRLSLQAEVQTTPGGVALAASSGAGNQVTTALQPGQFFDTMVDDVPLRFALRTPPGLRGPGF